MSTTFPPPSSSQRPSPSQGGGCPPASLTPGARPRSADRDVLDMLDMLDFPAVRRALSAHVRFGPALALADRIEPSFDAARVAELHSETVQARRLLQAAGDCDLTLSEAPSGNPDCDAAAAVARTALGGVATGVELVAIARTVRVIERATALSARAAVAPSLAALASRIGDLPGTGELVLATGRIEGSVSERGEVLDGASAALRRVRIGVRRAYGAVTAALSGMIDSDIRPALQDGVISLRGERFVLQVRSDMRGKVPGIVHDTSKSGSTLYVEPLATVELGNLWRDLRLKEEREVARILAELSESVGRTADAFAEGVRLAARIDIALARARHGISTGAITPSAGDWQAPGARPGVMLAEARHPLLGDGAVPISIQLGPRQPGEPDQPDWSVLVITGPNTGGKTVAMKTLGLLVAMNQSGIQIPAGEGSVLPFFDSLHADVGDSQSVERSVSTFSSHVGRVVSILAAAGPGSLVLLDELGSGTDPEEGAALARAILDRLAARGIPSVVTTHHRSVAAHATSSPGMENACVELDPFTLQPTYRLSMGEAGRSYALAVAEGLGMPRDVIDAAGAYVDPASVRYEESVRELRRATAAAEDARARAEASQSSARLARSEIEAERAEMLARKNEIEEQMRERLALRYGELTKHLARAEAALSWAVQGPLPPSFPGGDSGEAAGRSQLDDARQELAEAGRMLDRLGESPEMCSRAAPSRASGPETVTVGEIVEVGGLGAKGVVEAVCPESGEAEVSMGSVRLRLQMTKLASTGDRRAREPAVASVKLGPTLESGELDLRGMRAEDAVLKVERFLDRAARDGMSSVRIVHGRATGALRRAVHGRLADHPLVSAFACEGPGRGGDGATRVDLV